MAIKSKPFCRAALLKYNVLKVFYSTLAPWQEWSVPERRGPARGREGPRECPQPSAAGRFHPHELSFASCPTFASWTPKLYADLNR